jgi:autotransporter-associated beta strand protein
VRTSHPFRLVCAALGVALSSSVLALVAAAPPAAAVGTGATKVLITSSRNPAPIAGMVTFTITVAPVGAGAVPTGTVVVQEDGADMTGSPATLDGSGVTTVQKTYNANGHHVITAVYSGDAAYASSSAAPKEQTVDPLVVEKKWVGSVSDSNWSTDGNWNPPLKPTNTDTAVFENNTNPVVIDGAATAKHVSFRNTSEGRTVTASGAGALTLADGGSIHVDTPSAVSINAPVALGGTQQIVDGTLNLGGILSGSGGLKSYGAVVPSAVNTYTGATDVVSGVLSATNGASLGAASTGTTVADGASLKVASGLSVTEPLTLTGNGVSAAVGALDLPAANTVAGTVTLTGTQATISNAGAASIIGVVSGAGKLVKTGAGKLSLNPAATGVNTYTGGTDANGGTVATIKAAGFGTGAVAVGPGVTLSIESAVVVPNNISTAAGSVLTATAAGVRLTGPVVLGGATSVLTTGSNSLEFDNVVSGAGSLTKNGTGEAFLSGATANTYSGGTTVTKGLLDVGKVNKVAAIPGAVSVGGACSTTTAGDCPGLALDNDDQLADTSAVTVAANATFDALGFSDLFASLTSAGTTYLGILDPNSAANSSYSLVRLTTLSLTGGTLNAVVSGGTPGVNQDQLRVSGTVALGGVLAMDGDVPFGTTVKLIDNTGSSAVTGTFTGLAEGATVNTRTRSAVISYHGGDGNDVTLSAPTARSGYWMLGAGGKVYPFGNAQHYGDLSGTALPAGVTPVDIEPTHDYKGYWILTSDGAVWAFGNAPYLGGAEDDLFFGERATSISNDGVDNYWVFTDKGAAIDFGNAGFFDDMSGVPLNGPVLGSVSTASGEGYWMVGSDGGIFSFGDADYYGSMGGKPLNGRVVGLAPDPDGVGYWLVGEDGGIFAFSAGFKGSMGGKSLNQAVIGMVAYADGYLMVASDGGIFNFSSKPFQGSLGGQAIPAPIVGVAALNEH